jgi:asparagine synthase (glutamine-hydrolysing)
MCGIAGGWWRESVSSMDQRLQAALQALSRRGPDDRGHESYALNGATVSLGHTRLSIIDLTAAGHQPMHSADAVLSLVFNGEIYNYRELRKQLEAEGCRFVSDSDTEVLLQAWQRWGESCLPRLTGMFAFVMLDRAAGRMICVRDPFGIKPFFYARETGSFLFASELAALKALKQEAVELDWQRSYDYLVHGEYDSSERTFFRDVLHLEPGHLIEVDVRTGQVSAPRRWWAPAIRPAEVTSFAEAAEQLRETFLDSIRLHLRSDVPLGAALSGGIDSSAVVCAMRHVEPDLQINTFSFIARGSAVSEEHWVDRINRQVGAVEHKILVTSDELARDLDDMLIAQGEPFGSTSIYAQYRVFQRAREAGVTVTLDGQGADEMLAGYAGYPGQRLRSLLETGHPVQAWGFLTRWAQWPGRSRVEGMKRLLGELAPDALYDAMRRFNGMPDSPEWIRTGPLDEAGVSTRFPRLPSMSDARGRRVVAELAASLTRRGLPALLRHADRNSMRFSVESRVPFLTTTMVDLLLGMPEHYLVSEKGETKSVFRAAMRGIVPDDVLDRRDKLGFATPEQEWLMGMTDTIRDWLRDDLGLPFFDQSRVRVIFEEVMAGRRPFSWQVWRWINFCRWHRVMIG